MTKKPIILTIEFTDKQAAENWAATFRAHTGNSVRHVELSTDHPYRGEVERVFLELAERQVIPVATKSDKPVSRERAVEHVLSVDECWVSLLDEETGAKGRVCLILGNEPGVAVADWSAAISSSLWEKLEEVSTVVNDFYGS